jgi:hypothetical protein
MKADTFRFGTVTVPDGSKGPWRVISFTITEEETRSLWNIRNALRNPAMIVRAGTFKRLTHDRRGVIMSNTRMEVNTAYEAFHDATGRVLINGLGLGMVLEGILSKPEVEYVRVVELDQDVIDLVGPHFKNDKRVEIICADAYTYRPAKGEKFDYVWHDIWDDINEENLPLMAKLTRGYSRFAVKQGVWSRDMCRRQRRESSRNGW